MRLITLLMPVIIQWAFNKCRSPRVMKLARHIIHQSLVAVQRGYRRLRPTTHFCVLGRLNQTMSAGGNAQGEKGNAA